MKNVVSLAFVILLPCVSVCAGVAQDDLPLTPKSDQPRAPDFDLAGPNGHVYRLSDYRGKPVVLNFWATWCPPCVAEMPSMQRAYASFVKEGIELLAINVGDDPDSVREFLAENPVSFPIPIDAGSEVARQYGLTGVPTTLVVDPQGRISYSVMGELEWTSPELLQQLRALK